MYKQSKDMVLNKISNHYVLRSVYKLSVLLDVEMKFDLLSSVIRSPCLARDQNLQWRNLDTFFLSVVECSFYSYI